MINADNGINAVLLLHFVSNQLSRTNQNQVIVKRRQIYGTNPRIFCVLILIFYGFNIQHAV